MQKHHLNQCCFLALSLRYEINQLKEVCFDSKLPFYTNLIMKYLIKNIHKKSKYIKISDVLHYPRYKEYSLINKIISFWLLL